MRAHQGLASWIGELGPVYPRAGGEGSAMSVRTSTAGRCSVVAPGPKPLVKALARAWRWQRMLDDGIYTTVSDIGDAENISKSYVSRILRLALLTPNIVEEILVG